MTLTVDDLRNPRNASGFRNVGENGDPSVTPKPYQAFDGRAEGPTRKHRWKGPRRATADEAAQDYCDYVNGGKVENVVRLRPAGHSGRRAPLQRDPEVEAALGVLRDVRGQREGRQGYVYLIVEEYPGGGLHYGKIGYSTNPAARVAELQCGNPRQLRLHGIKPAPATEEGVMHARYAHLNVLQEWFHITGELVREFTPVPSEVPARMSA